MTPPPFVVFAMPRSSSAWLSQWLSCNGWHCGHDQMRFMRTPDDVNAWLSTPYFGVVETGGAYWWRTIRAMAPEAMVVVLRRPRAAVLGSLAQLGYRSPEITRVVDQIERKLDQVAARWPGAMEVDYAGLRQQSVASDVFSHCTGTLPPKGRWEAMSRANIQIDFHAMVRYMAANRAPLETLRKQMKHLTLRQMTARPMADIAGMVIEPEPFEVGYADKTAQELFADHLVLVGESPDAAHTKNIALHEQMEKMGRQVCIAARSNGRVFGYMVLILSPSFESPDIRRATQTTFYADPSVPGLGLRMARRAVEIMKDRGYDEIIWQDGVRGTGGRNNVIFRRLGSEEQGTVWRLKLEQ